MEGLLTYLYFQSFLLFFRHEKTVEDMKQELTHVSNVSIMLQIMLCVCVYYLCRLVKELELRMTEASEQLQQHLSANDRG